MKRLLLFVAALLFSALALAAVNINTATKEELDALPGIGPVKAQAILDYRKTHGSFKSVEELKDVKGIGAKRYEKLKGELTVSATAAKAAPKDEKSPPAAASSPQSRNGQAAAKGLK